MTAYRVGAVQFAPVQGDVKGNIQQMGRLSDEAACDLLIFPELASTGYFFLHPDELRQFSEEPESGVFCQWIRSCAQDQQRVVVAGFAERSGENLYNSALIAFPDQTFKVYRKTHLFYKEHQIFSPGDTGFFVVEWEGVRIGTMICYDWRFPESARTLALEGADIIAHPSNLVSQKRYWGPVMQTRSFENKVVTITANRYGTEEREGEVLLFSGESQITDMNGGVLAEAGEAEDRLIAAEVFPEKTREKRFNQVNDLFEDRRPEMYRLD